MIRPFNTLHTELFDTTEESATAQCSNSHRKFYQNKYILGSTAVGVVLAGMIAHRSIEFPAAEQASAATEVSSITPIPKPSYDTSLTVADYNAHYHVPAQETVSEITKLLEQSDFVGVEEFTGPKKREGAKTQIPLCKSCEYNGYIPEDPNSESAAFWKTKRFRMDTFSAYQLHEKNKIYITNADGTRSKIKQKTLTIVSGTDLKDNTPIGFVVVHDIYGLQDGDELKRDERQRLEIYNRERKIIIDKIKEFIDKNIPLVVVGDLNFTPGLSDPDTLEFMLKELGFQSMYEPVVVNLTPDEQYTHDLTKADLDYILAYRNVFTIVQRKNLGDWASDHDPVWARIVKKKYS